MKFADGFWALFLCILEEQLFLVQKTAARVGGG
jgi:hypothetical protein